MKKINLAIFILAAILTMANLMQGQTMKTDTSFFKNGTVMELNTYSNHVRVERAVYYPTGEIQLYQEFDPTTGLQVNDEFWYYRNGEVEHSCEWVNGFAHGWAFTWDESGNCTKTEVYVQNVLIPTDQHYKYFPDREVDSESASVSGFAIRR
jgi:antitoxin component YwqK of YwqJK toxin-antitoxin module